MDVGNSPSASRLDAVSIISRHSSVASLAAPVAAVQSSVAFSVAFVAAFALLVAVFAFPTPDEAEPYPDGAADVRQSGYELDDIDFSRFGVYILNGTDDNVLKAPDVRPNLTINTKGEAGVSYDDEIVMYKPKDVVVKMLIRAANVTVFWERWNALFTALIKPDIRRLYIDKTVEEFDCFYRKCSVTKFDILRNGRVWCEFSVTLTFTNSRPTGNYALLVTEDDELVLTEDGESYILLRND